MKINTAKFVLSSPNLKGCPDPTVPEFAFIGRSNVGKSSLINMLCNQKDLAKTSSKPGKTRLINYFIINNDWFLVDLPGYGYAKTAKAQREKWEIETRNYLLKRENISVIFLLIDVRIPPQVIDTEFMRWLSKNQLPFVILFTKCDKISLNKIRNNVKAFSDELLKSWSELPVAILTSAETGKGKEDILQLIETAIEDLK
ncbi:MAG: ribosome biogenesis GTP-binding protein YihA/YsxC [Bacteroidales bacterium]|jgi:GTP-binding protein|nr:ribosome biogenesis GTP-binding protein YihA/YsxC [Bacteroidales bacterium]